MKKIAVLFLVCLVTMISFARAAQSAENIKILDYNKLPQLTKELTDEFHKKGYVAIRGVPGFADAYKGFLEVAQQFIALSSEEKAPCTPDDAYARGWSSGIESFNGLRDSFKGSYYAWLEGEKPNIWPSLPSFEERYMKLAALIHNTGKELLPLIGLNIATNGLGRMLYYAPVLDENKEDGNPNWCGNHRDHGLFTGLCPEIFYKDGQIVEKPAGSGLYIREEAINAPADVLLFQIGEAAELLTQGKVTATDHLVKKAYGGFERYAFGFFFQPCDADLKIDCNHSKVIEKYQDRYRKNMTYADWNSNSLKKYNKT